LRRVREGASSLMSPLGVQARELIFDRSGGEPERQTSPD
jgi:hypothetical protein